MPEMLLSKTSKD